MYRLLIADDEPLEREGLEWIIGRMYPDTFEIIHADTGRSAIALAEEYRPHIVFMDIHMPGIQGLEALKLIQGSVPNVKMVLVTAYDYFSYAQEAVTLGVKEYIVKPASREQIVQTLKRILHELDEAKVKREMNLELQHKVSLLEPMVENELALTLMVDQIHSTDAEQLAKWLMFPLDLGYAIVIAFSEQTDRKDSKNAYDQVHSFAKAHTSSCIVSSIIDRHITIFVRIDDEKKSTDWKKEARLFSTQLTSVLIRQISANLSLGIGSPHEGADGLRTSYFEAVFASTFNTGEGRTTFFDELAHPKNNNTANASSASFASETKEHRSYVISALQRIRDERERRTISVLDLAKQYIHKRFESDISLEEVAEHVHLNPYYFSKIFKQQFGESFTDMVTKLRVEKAKKLILAREMSLKEICFEVGYKDPNYFSRVFKKVTGVTPTEFRLQTNES